MIVSIHGGLIDTERAAAGIAQWRRIIDLFCRNELHFAEGELVKMGDRFHFPFKPNRIYQLINNNGVFGYYLEHKRFIPLGRGYTGLKGNVMTFLYKVSDGE